MTDLEGGFYATQDADSEGEEGKFFVWDPEEIRQRTRLGRDRREGSARVLRRNPEGNFEDHGRSTGKTVLHESRPMAAVAAKLDLW